MTNYEKIMSEMTVEKLAELIGCSAAANIGTWDEGIYHPAPGFTSKYYMED